jgi:WD40 repeat protein
MDPQLSSSVQIRRWTARDARWLICLAFVIVLTACSGNRPIKPWADLQMPGVQKIPGIEALQPMSAAARVYSAMTYQSKLDGNAIHVLFENGQAAYDMRLDGSQLHPVTLPCYDSVAVAPGGQWLVCSSNTGIQIHDLTQRTPDFTLDNAGQYAGNSTWAPDGRHLAVVTDLAGGCSIGIFAITFDSRQTTLVALLSLPQFATQAADTVGCSVKSLAWSPDGTQLAFLDLGTQRLYDLPITSLQLLTRPVTAPPITQVISGNQVVQIGERCCLHSGLAWDASSKALTYVDIIGRAIKQVDIATQEITTVLTQDAAGVFSPSWTPDGKQLLFVLGIASDELTPPPSQIYVYTPPDA